MGKQRKGDGASRLPPERTTTDSERNFRKQSKIHDLLNSVKDDVVVRMKDNNEMFQDEVQTDPSSLSIPGRSDVTFEQRNFMRVSPQKTLNHDDSKWKKAVRLSKVMMIRPLQSLSKTRTSSNRDFNKGSESDEEVEEESSSIKMIGLLKTIDHASCIASGILTGLLLWSTMSTISWNYGTMTTRVFYNNENFTRFYYSTLLILTYLTLIGFLIRIQRAVSPFSGLGKTLFIYLMTALLAILIFSSKGFELFRLECNTYHHLSTEAKSKVVNPISCPRSTLPTEDSNNAEIILVFVTNLLQTAAIFGLTCYFHFSPYNVEQQ